MFADKFTLIYINTIGDVRGDTPMAEQDHSDRSAGEVGHYFDQVHFDLHYQRLARRAEAAAMDNELDALGVSVDPVTGQVTVTDTKATDS